MNNTLELRIEHGALTEVPCYEDHRRGRNWAAVIRPDPKSPGGLHRRFWERARGKYYYFPECEVGDPVEFGADYYTAVGNRRDRRVYGVVRELRDDALVLEVFDSAQEALDRAKEVKEVENAK